MSGAPMVRSLGEIAGDENVSTDPRDLQAYAIDGSVPGTVVRPSSAEQIAEVLRYCTLEKLAVVPAGAGSKLRQGAAPTRYNVALTTTRLDRILAYDPGDLTLGIEAGALLADVQAELARQGQFLPLTVPYWRQTTIGGTLASGVDSPLRQHYGTARDFVLGAEFVAGSGTTAHGGGRVVKNVAGYDLHKLFIGSLGTLGILTRVNFKTFPLPEVSRGFLASFADERGALDMAERIRQSPVSPFTLEILSPTLAGLFARRTPPTDPDLALPGSWFPTSEWLVAAECGGSEAVLDRCMRDLGRMASESGATHTEILGDDRRAAVWGRLREAIPLLLDASPAAVVVRITVVPGQIGEILSATRRIADVHGLHTALLVRAVGVIYIALLPEKLDEEELNKPAQAIEKWLETAANADGFASVPWCPSELKKRIRLWGAERSDLPLMRRLKAVFDPEAILSPGRFVGGI